MLKTLPFLVVMRAGYPATPLYPGMKLMEHNDLIISNISSTIVRTRRMVGLAIDTLVPGEILDYVVKNGLY